MELEEQCAELRQTKLFQRIEAKAAESGQVCRVAVVDITEFERSQERKIELDLELEQGVRERTAELESSNRALQQLCNELEVFSYTVAHELRTPLLSMCGFSNILLDDYPDKLDETGRDMLQRIGGAAERMGQLIDGILDLSRLKCTKLHKKRVNLSLLAHDVVKVFRELEPERKVDTAIAEEVYAHGDPDLLRLVLENLLGNAWKYTGKSQAPSIGFGAGSINGEDIYFVRDNGAGFDMSHTANLFTPFVRLHGLSDFDGLGIGLATVQRVVTRHKGRVWAQGTPGEGATFYFSLGPTQDPASTI